MSVAVVVVIAGVVVVVILAITGFFSSDRKLVMSPGEVHVILGQKAKVNAVAMRKKAWSYSLKQETNSRQFTFVNAGSVVFSFATSSTPTADATGLATVEIVGGAVGTGGLKGEAASSRPGKTYGPSTIKVHVYANAAAVPPGVQLTPN